MSPHRAGTADHRAGAVARGASVWQSLVIRTDSEGKLQWQRVDQQRASDVAALGTLGWVASSSAARPVAKRGERVGGEGVRGRQRSAARARLRRMA